MCSKTVRRLTCGLILGATLIGSATAFGADSNDKKTGLPLHPGLTFQQEVDSFVCGKKASMNIYDTPAGASLEEYMTWH